LHVSIQRSGNKEFSLYIGAVSFFTRGAVNRMLRKKDGGGAINGSTPRMVGFDLHEFTDCDRPRSHINGCIQHKCCHYYYT